MPRGDESGAEQRSMITASALGFLQHICQLMHHFGQMEYFGLAKCVDLVVQQFYFKLRPRTTRCRIGQDRCAPSRHESLFIWSGPSECENFPEMPRYPPTLVWRELRRMRREQDT